MTSHALSINKGYGQTCVDLVTDYVRTELACDYFPIPYHRGWTPVYFMYDPKCSRTYPWYTINAPAAFAWCTINVPMAFTWCTNHFIPLHWRHNDHGEVSNHQPHGCLLNRLFRRRSKKTSNLHVTGICAGNSPGAVNSPHKGPVTRKMFPFDDVIMT